MDDVDEIVHSHGQILLTRLAVTHPLVNDDARDSAQMLSLILSLTDPRAQTHGLDRLDLDGELVLAKTDVGQITDVTSADLDLSVDELRSAIRPLLFEVVRDQALETRTLLAVGVGHQIVLQVSWWCRHSRWQWRNL